MKLAETAEQEYFRLFKLKTIKPIKLSFDDILLQKVVNTTGSFDYASNIELDTIKSYCNCLRHEIIE